MKSLNRLGVASLLALATGISASSALAQTADGDHASKGTSRLTWSTRVPVTGPTATIVNTSNLVLTMGGDLDPVATPATEPLLLVDMPTATLEATWLDDKTITISTVEGTLKDGILKAHHTLAPHIAATLTISGYSFSFNYNATQLVSQAPGGKWAYNGLKQLAFDPWAFAELSLAVPVDPDINHLNLVSTSFASLGLSTNTATGTLAISGRIENELFKYKSTGVAINGGTPIAAAGGSTKIPTVNADFLDLSVVAKGVIAYSGNLRIGPSITITRIGDPNGNNLGPTGLAAACQIAPAPFEPGAGFQNCVVDLTSVASIADLAYASTDTGKAPIAVNFPVTTFHIPLPNVSAAKALDFGEVLLGEKKLDKASIKNTGEKQATLAFKSSDPQFVVSATAASSAAPKSAYDLEITFTPDSEGLKTATITVSSNDPDQPEQTITVTGTGTVKAVAEPTPPPADNDAGVANAAAGGSDGCGCHVQGTSKSEHLAFLGLGVLGLALVRRRRAR
ncbi:MAG: hypothetical protein JWM74_2554 [Myxococcaceae bacterium]|nr:hypothetical protein [Myxococcaceae bacterium]